MWKPAVLALALVLVASPSAATTGGEEQLLYRWRLDGWLGNLAALFVPSHGDGVLSREQVDGGVVRSELLVTSSNTRADEYFRYGAEWEPTTGRTLSAWSELVWRGERKTKRASLDSADVVGIASAIDLLRRQPPERVRRLEIWSDGSVYPVMIVPRGRVRREVDGREVDVRRISVLGVNVPGRKLWKGELDLWIADDPHATPVEILVARRGAKVRLELVAANRELPRADQKPAAREERKEESR